MNSKTDQFSAKSNSAESVKIQDFDWIDVFSYGVFITDTSWKLISFNKGFQRLLAISNENQYRNQDIFQLLGLIADKPNSPLKEVRSLFFTLPGKDVTLNLKIINVCHQGVTYGLGMLSEAALNIRDDEWCHHFQYHLMKNQQNHILEQRLEGLIHNINTPLNTIIGYVQILLRESPKSKALLKIMESGLQIDASLKSVQEKIAGNRSRFVQQIDVNHVILNELEIGKNNLFFKHNVQLQLALTDDLPLVSMVHGDLSYCIDAILWNAIESMYDSEIKDLYIETRLEDNWLLITIRDTGCGILPQDMPFLFEYGFSKKVDDKQTHLGLGLSFTKQIIHDYSGKITLNSVFQDGTTVMIYLPLEDLL